MRMFYGSARLEDKSRALKSCTCLCIARHVTWPHYSTIRPPPTPSRPFASFCLKQHPSLSPSSVHTMASVQQDDAVEGPNDEIDLLITTLAAGLNYIHRVFHFLGDQSLRWNTSRYVERRGLKKLSNKCVDDMHLWNSLHSDSVGPEEIAESYDHLDWLEAQYGWIRGQRTSLRIDRDMILGNSRDMARVASKELRRAIATVWARNGDGLDYQRLGRLLYKWESIWEEVNGLLGTVGKDLPWQKWDPRRRVPYGWRLPVSWEAEL